MNINEKKKKLLQLSRLTSLKADLALARLAEAQIACKQTENILQALEEKIQHAAPGLDPLMRAEASALYQIWATPRQIALNTKLARQRAEAEDIKSIARYELSRSDLMPKLTRNL